MINKDDRELNHVIAKTIQWHHDRNLVDGSEDVIQLAKLYEEVGELAGHIAGDGSDFRDHVGDIMVVLINMCERNGTSLETCLNVAYEEIKDRTGRMVEGVFVKDAA